VFDMEVKEKHLMKPLFADVESLKWRMDGMEKMLETLIEMYTDVFYEVRGEYVEKIENIQKEGEFERFLSIEDLRRSIEEN